MKYESKKTIVSIAGLVTLSLSLWGYQTYLVPKQREQNYSVVYVANRDIPTDTTIGAEMLDGVKVNQDSIVEGAITDKDDAVGKRITGGILTGEMLFSQRLSEDMKERGELFIRVESDYPIDLKDGEHVRVFAQGDAGITELFNRKEIYSTQRVINFVDGEAVAGFYLLLSEDELESYYLAKSSGMIILAKIDTVAKSTDKASGTRNPIVIDTSKSDTESTVEPSNNRYTVEEGQTLSEIATELETTPEALTTLNDGQTEVKAGDILIIP